MKQFLINLLGILYILTFFITCITTIICFFCVIEPDFLNWLLLSILLLIIHISVLPQLTKYLEDNKFMEKL